MARRGTPEVNAGSMADIAFLLLIFFLVTTTMSVDTGILRQLPPPPHGDQSKAPQVHERNLFTVLVNKDNLLAIKGNPAEVSELRDKVKIFFTNPSNDENLSVQLNVQAALAKELKSNKPNKEKIEIYKKIISEIGPNVAITQGVVSLQNDRTTKYGKYIEVQNEIVGAINELRNELAQQVWGKTFEQLNEDQQLLVTTIYPFAISEAEPRSLASK